MKRLIIVSCVLMGCGASTASENGVPVGADGTYSTGDVGLTTESDTGSESDGLALEADVSFMDTGAQADSGAPPVADVAGTTEVWSEDVVASEPDAAPMPVSDAGAAVDVAQVEPDVGVEQEPVEVPYDPCAAENLAVDTDGDGWSDCDEISDDLESTDPTQFNGLTATVGVPPEGFLSSAQCGLFFGTDYGELDQHFTPSDQSMSVRSGWEYSASTTAEYGDESNFDFDPNWDDSHNVGVWDSFQLLFTGWIHLDQSTTYCFSVDTGAGGIGPGDIAGRRNNCGLFYINPEPATAPLAETGYGSNESPHTGCEAYDAGWHRIAIAVRHYETYFYAPKLAIRLCHSENTSCNPTTALTQEQMWSDAEPVPLPEAITVEPVGGADAGGAEADSVSTEPDGGSSEPDVGPAGEAGACTNASDSGLIETLGVAGLEQGITDCGMPCFFDGDKQQCITDCIVSDLGLSADCAVCYAAPAACAMANCVSECIDGGADCDQCMVDYGCQDDFPACSGLDG